ncbi:MAG: S9 family peptidase [Pseudomonadales bacterium]|nr:S9 family peptidase [Pseudomonadales bacterium]
MMTQGKVVVVALVLLLAGNPSFGEVTVEQLIEWPLVADVKISPDAKTLGIRIYHEGKHALRFMDRETLKVVGGLDVPEGLEVGDIHWVNNERVIGQLLRFRGSLDAPQYYGELFGANIDGTQAEPIFGIMSGELQTGSAIKKRDSDRAWAEIIDLLPDDPDNIMISTTEWSRSLHKPARAELINVYTGIQKSLNVSTRYGLGEFKTDKDGVLRVMSSRDGHRTTYLQTLPEGSEEWIDMPEKAHGDYFRPVALSEDNQHVIVLDNLDGDRVGLYQLAMDGTDYSLMYGHDRVDVTRSLMTTDDRGVIGVRIDDGYPRYLFFPDPGPEGETFKALLQAFSGNTVSIRNKSKDGRFMIVRTGNDRERGAFYLLDRDRMKVTHLFSSHPNIDPDELAVMEPVSFTSFDGTRVDGYFSKGRTGKKDEIPPMVVLIHGGPRVRDYWGYDSLVQVLATRGYSVLQINYRGSTGYGKVFEDMGNREWGRNVQKDIIAGTRWAIEEGRADAERICIMGGSFGAYSALQSSILAPDLYRCAVANAGIYDLNLLYTDGDIETFYFGDAYLEEAIGRDEKQLKEFSPVHQVARLQTPVFIAHGKRDERAPYKHAKELRKALEEHDKEYEWFVKGGEAHGFYDDQNQLEFLTAALKFLERNLKK